MNKPFHLRENFYTETRVLLWKSINDNIAAKSKNSFRCRTKLANCGDANVEGKFEKRRTDWYYAVDNFQFIFLRFVTVYAILLKWCFVEFFEYSNPFEA